ncbi:unnamed protein product, partial [Symbiodinium sp. KB8]
MEELLENTITKRDRTIIQALKKQEATSADIARATHRMKTVWLGARCVRFFDSMLSAETMPTLIYDGRLAGIHGVEYFLAEIPFIGPNDERHLSDAIHIDEEENGKETVFAKNLKVVLGRVKQKKKKSGVNRSNTAIVSTGFGGGPGAGPTATLLASTEYEKVERNLTRDIERVHRFWNRLAMEKKREATTLSVRSIIDDHPLWLSFRGIVAVGHIQDGNWVPDVERVKFPGHIELDYGDKENFARAQSITFHSLMDARS